jgi:dipeptidyl aminopeptidase/acylaminoacyl peptidase
MLVGLRPAQQVLSAHNDTSTPFNLVSLPALVRHRFDGRGLRLDHVLTTGVAVTRHHVTYRSADLEISGVLSVPARRGRFPLVVLAHGYQDPARYRTGATLEREQTHLATRGYVVLQPDYRNHGDSDREATHAVRRPLGYPEDLVNAILAVRRARLPYVDTSRVGVIGRSMGGGVALNAVAARPGLVDALVLHSSVSSSAGDNFRRWVVGSGDLERHVVDAYGRPRENPAFWRRAGARAYAHRIDVPVQLHHGTADPICPVRWSRDTAAALGAAGQTVELYEYPGQVHSFDEAWPAMMERTAGFLDRHLG